MTCWLQSRDPASLIFLTYGWPVHGWADFNACLYYSFFRRKLYSVNRFWNNLEYDWINMTLWGSCSGTWLVLIISLTLLTFRLTRLSKAPAQNFSTIDVCMRSTNDLGCIPFDTCLVMHDKDGFLIRGPIAMTRYIRQTHLCMCVWRGMWRRRRAKRRRKAAGDLNIRAWPGHQQTITWSPHFLPPFCGGSFFVISPIHVSLPGGELELKELAFKPSPWFYFRHQPPSESRS